MLVEQPPFDHTKSPGQLKPRVGDKAGFSGCSEVIAVAHESSCHQFGRKAHAANQLSVRSAELHHLRSPHQSIG